MVAKSYQNLEILCEPFSVNNRLYTKVRTKSGAIKQVRFYTEKEYAKLYGGTEATQSPPTRSSTLGFGGPNNEIYLVKGDTEHLVDWLNASTARYNRPFSWFFTYEDKPSPDALPYGLSLVPLKWEAVSANNKLFDEKQLREIADSSRFDEGSSQYQGEVGERIDRQVVVANAIPIASNYGYSTLHTFKDANENIYVWLTASKILSIGNTYTIRGTVKEHKIYEGNKQTVLTRCSVLAKD